MPPRTLFPRNPADGAEIIDKEGTRYKYDLQTRSWVTTGTVTNPIVVDEKNNGLVSPDIYEKLSKVKSYIDNGGKFNFIKLRPGTDAHYYLLRSSDKCVRFKSEGEDTVRIELDRGRIHSIFANTTCVGPTGEQGDQGDKGPDGQAAQPEFCFAPTTRTDTKVEFAAIVPLAYTLADKDTLPNKHVPDISIRFHKVADYIKEEVTDPTITVVQGIENTKSTASAVSVIPAVDQITSLNALFKKIKRTSTQFEAFKANRQLNSLGLTKQAVNCDIPLSMVLDTGDSKIILEDPFIEVLVDPLGDVAPRFSSSTMDIDTENSTISYDAETGLLCVTLLLNSGKFEGLYCARASQRGPDGIKGICGERYLKIIKSYVDNTNVVATNPIVNLRYDSINRTMHYASADMTTETCAAYLLLGPTQATLNSADASNSNFAAVEMNLDDFKQLNYYTPHFITDDPPVLELPHWAPQEGCVTSRNFTKHNFDWASTLDPTCAQNLGNFSPSTSTGDVMPIKIVLPSEPPADTYNQADFFYVPNIQSGVVKANQTTPPSTNIVAGGNF